MLISDVYTLGLYQGEERDTTNPTRQVIQYNKVTGRWEPARDLVNDAPTVTRQSNLVKASTKHIIANRYKGGNV